MRKAVVVDTSLAIKWVLQEPYSDTASMLLSEWSKKKLVILAPTLLTYEITNALHQNVRKSEITLEEAKEALTKIFDKKLKFDFPPKPDLGRRTLELADRFGLPAAYDAYYLALAEREGCELWTADKRFWNSIQGKLTSYR